MVEVCVCVVREGGIYDGVVGSGLFMEVMGMRFCLVLKGVVVCLKKVVRFD